MKPFNVLFVSGSLHLSGSTVWIHNLIVAMARLGVPCAHVIVGRDKQIKSQATYSFCTGQAKKNFLIRLFRILRLHHWWPKLYAKIEDRYYCRVISNQLAEKLASQVLIIKDFSAPLPNFFVSPRFRVISVLHHQYDRRVEGKCDVLIAVSQEVMSASVKLGFPVDGVIFNPVDQKQILRKSEALVPEEEDYIVFVGRLVPSKGVLPLLKAFIQLYQSGRVRHQLMFVGSGSSEKALQEQARAAGLEKQVIFKGFQENPYPYIRHAELLVLPSYSESMGYVAVEASILGTSYLVSDFPAAKEFFPAENRFASDVSEDEFVRNMENGIQALLENPQVSLCDGVLEQMEPERVAKQFLRYQDVSS